MQINKRPAWIYGISMAVYIATFIIRFTTDHPVSWMYFLIALALQTACFLFLQNAPFLVFIGASGFVTCTLYFGSMLNFYRVFSWYDLFLHGTSGFLLFFAAHFFYRFLLRRHPAPNVPLTLPIYFDLFVATACAGLWEIYEFSADYLLGQHMQGPMTDSMTDMIAGTIGAIAAAVLVYRRFKRIPPDPDTRKIFTL